MVQTNPFTNLPIPKAVARRERVLSDDEIAEIWRAATEAGEPYGSIIRMLLLTGQRRGEVAGMTWTEISADLTTWTMPGVRTKNGVPHVVSLSGSARDLLRRMLPEDATEANHAMAERRASGTLAFAGLLGSPFARWSKAKDTLDKSIVDARAKAAAEAGTTPSTLVPWNVHDLRRTVATGLQRLGIRLEVTEAVLNHISGTRAGIAGVYQRHDWASEKCAALDAWAAHVLAVVNRGRPTPKVVTLVRASNT
jgi:integrase